jgi:hypothetical protein
MVFPKSMSEGADRSTSTYKTMAYGNSGYRSTMVPLFLIPADDLQSARYPDPNKHLDGHHGLVAVGTLHTRE